MIKNGTSIATASKLCNFLQQNQRENFRNFGTFEPALGRYIENKLEQWLLRCNRMGFPINTDCLIQSVKQTVQTEKLPNLFKYNVPRRKWFEIFFKRHPRIG